MAVGHNNSTVVLTAFKINCMAGRFVNGQNKVVERDVCCFFVKALPFFKFLSQCSQLPVYNS